MNFLLYPNTPTVLPTDYLLIARGSLANYKVPVSELLTGIQTTLSVPNNNIVGRYSTGLGVAENISLSSDFALSATGVLSLANPIFDLVAANSLVGNPSGTAGPLTSINIGNGLISAGGSLSLNPNLYINAITTPTVTVQDLVVQNSTSLTGPVTISGAVGVTGATTVNGNTALNGTVKTVNATLDDGTGKLTNVGITSGALTITGNSVFDGTILSTNATLNDGAGNMLVQKLSTKYNTIDDGSGNTSIHGNLTIAGNITTTASLTANYVFATPNGATGGLSARALVPQDMTFVELLARKGLANGYTPLDTSALIPLAFFPASVIGARNYIGLWNASTNTPTLASGVAPSVTSAVGAYYIVSVAGSTLIDGNTNWVVGDTIIWDGASWGQIVGTAAPVFSVAGYTGTVVLHYSDIIGAAPINNTTFTGLTTIPDVVIQRGTIDNTIIGSTTPVAGSFTQITTPKIIANASNVLTLVTPQLNVSSSGTNSIFNVQVGNITMGNGTSTFASFTPSLINITSTATSINGSLTVTGATTFPTAATTDNSQTVSTTAFVKNVVASTQTNVAITGGTINGTTIGATTPSTGAFTTLSANSLALANPATSANQAVQFSQLGNLNNYSEISSSSTLPDNIYGQAVGVADGVVVTLPVSSGVVGDTIYIFGIGNSGGSYTIQCQPSGYIYCPQLGLTSANSNSIFINSGSIVLLSRGAGLYNIIGGSILVTQSTTATFTGDLTTTAGLTVNNANAGISFSNNVASSLSDLSKHINLYGGTYGFNVQNGTLNYNVASGTAHNFLVGGTAVGDISSTGLNQIAIGASNPSTGKFTTLTSAKNTLDDGSGNAIIAGSLTSTNAVINGGSIDNTVIGANTPSTGTFTSITTTNISNKGSISVSASEFTVSGDTVINATATNSTLSRPLSDSLAELATALTFGVVQDLTGTLASANTPLFQAALSLAPSIKDLSVPAALSFEVNAAAVLPTNSRFTLDGTIKLANNTNTSVFEINSNTVLEGIGIIDGNLSNNTGATAVAGLFSNGASNLSIRDITVQNTYGFGIQFNGTSTNVTRIRLNNVGNYNPRVATNFAQIENFGWFQGTSSGAVDLALAINGPANGVWVADSFWTGNLGYSSFGSITDTTPNGITSNAIYSRNIILNTTNNGLSITSSVGTSHKDIVVGENLISGTTAYAMTIENLYGGDIFHNYVVGSNTLGINITNISGSLRVSMNRLRNVTGAGILYGDHINDLLIDGNYFDDDQSTPTQLYGINRASQGLGSATNLPMLGLNYFGPGIATPVVVYANAFSSIFGFYGQTAPALPTFLTYMGSKTTGYANSGISFGQFDGQTHYINGALGTTGGHVFREANATGVLGAPEFTISVNGNIKTVADQEISYLAIPPSGSTVTIPVGSRYVSIENGASLAALTFATLPTPVTLGTVAVEMSIYFATAISSITWPYIYGAALPQSVTAGAIVNLVFIQTLGAWSNTVVPDVATTLAITNETARAEAEEALLAPKLNPTFIGQTTLGLTNIYPGITSLTTAYPITGLSFGWDSVSGQGEVDLFLGPGGGVGGLNIYQLNGSTGVVNSTTPILALDAAGNFAVASAITSPLAIYTPQVVATGLSTNINLALYGKNAGGVTIGSATLGYTAIFGPSSNGTQANYLAFSSNGTGYGPVISVAGSDTDISLQFSAKGAGSIVFNSPIIATSAVSFGSTLGVSGAVTITDSSTTNSYSLLISTVSSSQGAGIKLLGGGTTTPSKVIRAFQGNLEFVNDGYNSVIARMSDTGGLQLFGPLQTTQGSSIETAAAGPFFTEYANGSTYGNAPSTALHIWKSDNATSGEVYFWSTIANGVTTGYMTNDGSITGNNFTGYSFNSRQNIAALPSNYDAFQGFELAADTATAGVTFSATDSRIITMGLGPLGPYIRTGLSNSLDLTSNVSVLVPTAINSNNAIPFGQAQRNGSDGSNFVSLNGATTLTVAQSGTTFVNGGTAAYTITLPAVSAGLNYRIYGSGAYAVTVAAVTANTILLPDNITISSYVLPISGLDFIELFCDGSYWRAFTSGRTVVAPAVNANEAIQYSQIQTFANSPTFNAGINFASNLASSPTDLTKQINLCQGKYGFSITNLAINYVVDTGANHNFIVGGTAVGDITSTGLNSMAVGATTASTGAFTSISATGLITANASIRSVTTGGDNRVTATLGMYAAPITIYSWGGYGSWLDFHSGITSGIGSGGPGANVWLAYAGSAGNFFSDAAAGDIVYRNVNAGLLFGTTTGTSDFNIRNSIATFRLGATFTGGLSSTGVAYLNGSVQSPNYIYFTGPSVTQSVTTTTGTTLTATDLVTNVLSRSGPTANFTDTLDTPANIIAQIGVGSFPNQTYTITIINNSSFMMTLAAPTNITIFGQNTIGANSGAKFLVYITNTTSGSQSLSFEYLYAVESKLYIEDFGGGTSVTDNGPAINAMINAGYAVRFKSGTYNITGELDLSTANVSFIGIPGLTTLFHTATGPYNWISFNGTNVSVTGIIFDSNSLDPSYIVISSTIVSSTIKDCTFKNNTSGDGLIYLTSSVTVISHLVENCIFTNNNNGINIEAVNNITVADCLVYGNANIGIRSDLSTSTVITNDLTIKNCIIYNNLGQGINLGPPTDPSTGLYSNTVPHSRRVKIIGNTVYNNGNYNIYAAATTESVISDNISYYNNTGTSAQSYGACILTDSSSYTTISNNILYGNSNFGLDAATMYYSTVQGNNLNGFTTSINVGGSQHVKIANNIILTGAVGIGVQLVEGDGSNVPFPLLQSLLTIDGNSIDYPVGGNAILIVDNAASTFVTNNNFVNLSEPTGINAVKDFTSQTVFSNNSINGVKKPVISFGTTSTLIIPDWVDSVFLSPTTSSSVLTSIVTQSQNTVGTGIGYVNVTEGGSGLTGVTASVTGGTTAATFTTFVYGGSLLAIRTFSNGAGYSGVIGSTITVNISETAGSGATAVATIGLPMASNRNIKFTNITTNTISLNSSDFSYVGSSLTINQYDEVDIVWLSNLPKIITKPINTLTGLAATYATISYVNTEVAASAGILIPQTITWSTSITPVFGVYGGSFYATATSSATLNVPSSVSPGKIFEFLITQDSVGGWVLTFGTGYVFGNGITPVLSTAANAKDRLTGVVLPDNTILITTIYSIAT